MPFLFRCPRCETETWVDAQFSGRTGPCATCGRLVTIPYFDAQTNVGVLAGEAPTTVGSESKARNAASFAIGAAVLALCMGALLIGLTILLWPLLASMHQGSQLSAGRKNLEKIVAALRSYEAKYGSLPPACTYGPDGKPAHSWRVLILPFLGYENLYKQYQLDRPWDDPVNSLVLRQMPAEFAAPNDPNAFDAKETSYMVFVGSQTAFPSRSAVPIQQIRDQANETILVVEIRAKGVAWTEPVDLDVGAANFSFSPNSGPGCPGTFHPTHLQAGMVDGTVRNIPLTVDAEDVEAMSTIGGGERLLKP